MNGKTWRVTADSPPEIRDYTDGRTIAREIPDRRDADMIVRAVQSHDALRAALAGALMALAEPPSWPHRAAAIQHAREILHGTERSTNA